VGWGHDPVKVLVLHCEVQRQPSPRTAGGLGAACDVVGGPRAGVADVVAAARGAFRGRDTDPTRAGAGTVNDRALG